MQYLLKFKVDNGVTVTDDSAIIEANTEEEAINLLRQYFTEKDHESMVDNIIVKKYYGTVFTGNHGYAPYKTPETDPCIDKLPMIIPAQSLANRITKTASCILVNTADNIIDRILLKYNVRIYHRRAYTNTKFPEVNLCVFYFKVKDFDTIVKVAEELKAAYLIRQIDYTNVIDHMCGN